MILAGAFGMQKEVSDDTERKQFSQLWKEHGDHKSTKIWSAKWADEDDDFEK